MIKRLNISIPIELSNRIGILKDNGIDLNISRICQAAIKETIIYCIDSLDIPSYIKLKKDITIKIADKEGIECYLNNKGIKII